MILFMSILLIDVFVVLYQTSKIFEYLGMLVMYGLQYLGCLWITDLSERDYLTEAKFL